MAEEPIGEERDDLRIGALASVFLNMNIDTKETGGILKPQSYISGWGEDRVYVLGVKSPEMEEAEARAKVDNSLNNPIVFDNFIANLAHGKEIQRS